MHGNFTGQWQRIWLASLGILFAYSKSKVKDLANDTAHF